METDLLGRPIQTFEASRDGREKIVLALVSLMAMGVIGLALGIYQSLASETIQLLMPMTGVAMCSVSGFLLYKLPSKLISVTVLENGIRVIERSGDTSIPWADLTKVERVNYSMDNGEPASQFFFETSGETNLLFGCADIVCFDEFAKLIAGNPKIIKVFEETNT